MIRYYGLEQGKLVEQEHRIPSCWIHIEQGTERKELEQISQEFEFPIDFLLDSLDIDERSRYEREEGVRFILVNTPILNELDQDNEAIYITVPIGVILFDDHLLTICARENPIINKFFEGKVKGFDPANVEKFVLQIFEQNVYHFLACLKKLNLKRNLIEQELYDSSRNEELKQLLRIEKSLVYFVNSLSTNELLNMKMKRTDFLKIGNDEDLTDLFEDIIIDNSQALEMSNVYTNILNGTMEAYASIVSNNLNTFIQRLTIVTIILMVPTLVASFYGMNISLPFDGTGGSKIVFFIIILISIIISLLLVWFFRRRRLF